MAQPPDWDAMAVVGRIVRPHGHKGNVVVSPETDFAADRFQRGASVFWNRDGQVSEVVVLESREQDGRWIVTLEGLTSMDAAESVRGLELRIAPDALQPLAPGRYYAHDLVGCRVETTDRRRVGIVERVELSTATPLLVVAGSRGEVLVPLAEPICRQIDLAGKIIVIDPPAGLIELNEPGARHDD